MTPESLLDGKVTLWPGDCRDALRHLPDASIDSVVTDPPYALVSVVKRFGKPGAAPARGDVYARAAAGFMGQQWDTGETAFAVGFWREVFRVLKPGGHVAAFSGTRTYHRLACAVEDAGFEIRDQLAWVYGSGFPKSHDVAKGIDAKLKFGAARTEDIRRLSMGAAYRPSGRGRANYDNGGSRMNGEVGPREPATDAARQWAGWGTALKPAWEPIVLARKPLVGTVAANVLAHGVGALNIDGCRVPAEKQTEWGGKGAGGNTWDETNNGLGKDGAPRPVDGRWHANVIHDGSDEVVSLFPQSNGSGPARTLKRGQRQDGEGWGMADQPGELRDAGTGSAARFFYSAKADADDRLGSKHPTVKPVDLMQWLVRLITPPGGLVLDPFAGTGTTGEAAWREGMRAVLVEREPAYQADIRRRMELALAGPATRRSAVGAAKAERGTDPLPLFAAE